MPPEPNSHPSEAFAPAVTWSGRAMTGVMEWVNMRAVVSLEGVIFGLPCFRRMSAGGEERPYNHPHGLRA